MLYVGKAKSLRPRVRSYFQQSQDSRTAIQQLPDRVEDIEVIVTQNEVEALHLEQNLVKRHRPPFNVRLRDDKSFPYIAVTVEDEYPRVMFTRERHRRGVVYFGPYANAKKVRETLDVLNRVFPYRPCEGPKPGRHSGIPCLDYHIERCLAPCVGYVSKEDYLAIIDQVIEFLSGDIEPIQRELERKMQEAAADERFEEAARYRNRLRSVQHLAERQAADLRSVGTIDVVGLAIEGDRAVVQVFPLRDGKLIDRYSFHLENVGGQDVPTVLESFFLEYYGSAPSLPPQIVVPREAGDTTALAGLPLGAARRAGRGARGRARGEAAPPGARGRERSSRARVGHPAGGAQAAATGRGARGASRGAQPRSPPDSDRVLRHLDRDGTGQRRLDGRLPGRRREEGALPQVRSQGPGRDGRLRCDGGGRLAALRPALATPPGEEYDESFAATPNLVVIDGGKGQLSAALAAMQAFDLPRVAVVALAKKVEEVFVPGAPDPIRLALHSPGLQLLQRVRDEAHRFAVGFHRQRRDARSFASIFDELEGVGPARRRALLQHFGSAERFVAATQEELEGVPGVPAKTARSIYAQLHKAGRG